MADDETSAGEAAPGRAKRDQPLFQPNLELIAGGELKAPVPLAPNSRHSLQGAFRLALERDGGRADQVLPASSTGGGLVHAAQDFVSAANRLISEPREKLADVARSLLWSCKEFLGFRDSAYVLKQAVDGSDSPGGAPRLGFRGMKDLSGPLERRLAELDLPVRMDPERFGVLQVHLDEMYDRASRILQLFYHALSAPEAPGEFCAFCRALASLTVGEIIPDLILGQGAGPDRARSGLADLLPELEREFL
jgi:hypothetical protein